MYEKLNITENHLRALGLFTRGFDKGYYIREVEKMLGVSPRTAQLVLDDLEKKGVLTSQLKGKIRIYRLQGTAAARDYVMLAEQYKKATFAESDSFLREITSRISAASDGVVAVFGSYAKGTQKEGSDMDVLVAGKCDMKKIKEASNLYGVEISVKNYTPGIFRNNAGSDALLKEVAENHVILSGLEQFISVVMGHG